MIRISRFAALSVMIAAFATAPVTAQEHLPGAEPAHASVPPGAEQAAEGQIDVQHHIGNSHELELPVLGVVELPRFAPVRLGRFELDLSPTKHTVFMVVSALIVFLTFMLSARSIGRAQAQGRHARGFPGAMEATALWIRQEVVTPNVGHHGEKYAPYLLTLFFFILVMNLLGLVPWGAAATGNISVTAGLAVIAFLVIEIGGMRSLGFKGYMQTIFYLPPGLPTILKPIMLIILTPVEIISKLSKPFALAVRLFANMTAGHVLVLALIGLTFLFQSWAVGIGASVMATGIMLLELFVAFLQAYVFTLLTAVFIGLMREAH